MSDPVYTNPAQNICGDELPSGRPNFHCSLVCCGRDRENGGVNWPMHSGTIQIFLYSEVCGSDAPGDTRLWQPGHFLIPLSCSQDANTDEFTCVWTGYAEAGTTQGECLIDGVLVPLGYKIRLTGIMEAIDFNTVDASFTLERLAAGSDFTPPQANNQWIICGSGGARCYRVLGEGEDPNDRQIPRTFVPTDLITLSDVGSICGDVRFASISVMMLPWRFGCHVGDTTCALAQSGSYYSCLQAYIEPIEIPRDTEPTAPVWPFLPQFAQLGVFDPFDVSRCLEGKASDFPAPADAAIFLCGCPGEGASVLQQIQYRMGVAGFELIVKSVQGESDICVALRQVGAGTYSVQPAIEIQETGPWTAYADFNGFGARVKLFGLKFPEGAVGDCTGDGTYVPPPEPIVYNYWKVCGPPGEDGIPDEETEGGGPAVDDDYVSFCLPYPEGEDPSEFYLYAFGPYLSMEDCESGLINGVAAYSCDPTQTYCWAICKPRIFGGSGVAYCLCLFGSTSIPPEPPEFILHWPDPFANAILCDDYLGPFPLECDA
jgi:hypothetical protein